MPRAGTSWVGKILGASGQLVYVNEPLNPGHPPGRSPGVLNAHVTHRYQYINGDNEDQWLGAFRDTIALRYRFVPELRTNHSPYDLARMLKYGFAFTRGRLTGKRALLDDPFALMSVPWLVDRLGCAAVVLIRSPVGLVGSWRKLGWKADVSALLAQPTLMRDHLEPYREDLESYEHSSDVLGRMCALWRALYGAVAEMRRLGDVHVHRYEDLVSDPRSAFSSMYQDSGLTWAERTDEAIEESTNGGGSTKSHAFRGLSKTAYRPMSAGTALNSYRSRLSDEEIARVKNATADVSALFYDMAQN